MKPTLQLKLSQQLKLTPQLQQSIRLLQMSTLDLNQEIERAIQENPLLELTEDYSSPDLSAEDQHGTNASEASTNTEENLPANSDSEPVIEWTDNNYVSRETPDGDHDFPQIAAKSENLREHLNGQVCLSQMSERERNVTFLLIDSLDERGYLPQNLDELHAFLPHELEVSRSELEHALKYLQRLDPTGVGARDLRECLLLQLNNKPKDTPHLEEAIKVVEHHLKTLAAHDFVQIKKLLQCSDETLRSIRQLITNLNPKPGHLFNTVDTRYIVPDILVEKTNGIWGARLNFDAIPRLSVNHLYAKMLRYRRDKPSRELTDQLIEAKWLIKNIQQRSSTILSVSQAIVERQQQFFEHGEVAMRPLVLREIANSLELHESTISRVTTQKFMHTPRGIFELKYFFGSHVSTETGGACSATAIRALIKQLVQTENQKKPLSDNRISLLLEEQGIVVARRTIAKYRESMQIPPANLRKSF